MTFKDTFVVYETEEGKDVHPMSCTKQFKDGILLITARGKHILFLPTGTYSVEERDVQQIVVDEDYMPVSTKRRVIKLA